MQTPHHIAIIMDGNRRWAKNKGLDSFDGHKKGMERVREIIEAANDLGIKVLTFYCFSTENWKRDKREIGYLMRLFNQYIKKYLEDLMKNNCRLKHIGRKDRLPKSLLKTLENAEKKSKNNTAALVQLAIDYGGRDEILRATNKAIKNGIPLKSEDDLASLLDTKQNSNVDLLIRTSGEQRTSNFLIWQLAYSEFIFLDCHFPDFTPKKLKESIEKYHKRKRRLGQ